MASRSLFLMPVPLVIGHANTRLSTERDAEVGDFPGHLNARGITQGTNARLGARPTIASRASGRCRRTRGNTSRARNSAALTLGA